MDGIKNEKDYVEINSRSIDEKIVAVENKIRANEDKSIVRAVFKELKYFVRAEYETFHKRKYFGTYIFEKYHPLLEKIHINALGETRVNATVGEIEEAISEARNHMSCWLENKPKMEEN